MTSLSSAEEPVPRIVWVTASSSSSCICFPFCCLCLCHRRPWQCCQCPPAPGQPLGCPPKPQSSSLAVHPSSLSHLCCLSLDVGLCQCPGLYLGKISCGCGPQGLIPLQVPHRATSRGRSPATPSKEDGERCPSLSPQPRAPNFTSTEQHRAPAPAPFGSGPVEKAGLGWPTSLEVSPGPHQTTLAQGWAETPFLPRLLLAKTKLDLICGLCRLRWGC